ncbi:Asp23/Gls24 family envelope stress response protein [Streptosporangium roseum]|uniref:Asp23/Gls24 family envelope stress response protein n=1 Tax=Streptosporangium roseum TaxID=2001 RepID=UPI000689B266|nr:Asp23/Gls24 family envelope stress response protein [Streptosporangium roseum]
MTDVSVEDITEETDSPAETTTAARPFSLSLSTSSIPSTPPITIPSVPPVPPVPPVALVADPEPVTEPVAAAVVKGRIKVADEVVEKVAALAALEVAGVADLGSGLTDAVESIRERAGAGARRGPRGVSAHVQERTVAVDVAIVAEYGHVVMDVANEVKTNVARTVSRMLGMRVVEVNVNVDDVRLPGEDHPEAPAEP